MIVVVIPVKIFVSVADHHKSSSDEDDDHGDSCDEQRNLNTNTSNQGLAPAFIRKPLPKRKKRTGPTTSNEPLTHFPLKTKIKSILINRH